MEFFFFYGVINPYKTSNLPVIALWIIIFFSLSPHFADSGFSLVNIWDFHWLTLLPSSKRY